MIKKDILLLLFVCLNYTLIYLIVQKLFWFKILHRLKKELIIFNFFDETLHFFLPNKGTGHGVGALLNVHEVPIIGNRKSIELGLQENMIVTIEPGYYENDKFGIRIENCVLAMKAATKYKYASNVDFLTFEPLTYVPIQRELIDKSLLDADELNWLNSYHAKCAELIGAELKKAGQNDVYEWLLEQTKPI